MVEFFDEIEWRLIITMETINSTKFYQKVSIYKCIEELIYIHILVFSPTKSLKEIEFFTCRRDHLCQFSKRKFIQLLLKRGGTQIVQKKAAFSGTRCNYRYIFLVYNLIVKNNDFLIFYCPACRKENCCWSVPTPCLGSVVKERSCTAN